MFLFIPYRSPGGMHSFDPTASALSLSLCYSLSVAPILFICRINNISLVSLWLSFIHCNAVLLVFWEAYHSVWTNFFYSSSSSSSLFLLLLLLMFSSFFTCFDYVCRRVGFLHSFICKWCSCNAHSRTHSALSRWLWCTRKFYHTINIIETAHRLKFA